METLGLTFTYARNQKNDQYSGNTAEEKWDSFYSKTEEYISDGVDSTKNIAVIGITDYLSIDNYLKVSLKPCLHGSDAHELKKYLNRMRRDIAG